MSEVKKQYGGEWHPKYLVYLSAMFMMTILTSQLLNLKSINLFGLSVVGSIIVFPISLILCDIMTEVYGYKRMRKVIFACMGFYVIANILIQISVYLPPANDYPRNDVYVSFFSQLPQILIGGILGFLSGDLVNSYLMSHLKVKTQGKYFWFRALFSTVLSQIANCIVFFGIGFWGIMPLNTIITSSLISIGTILVYEMIALPFTYRLSVKLKEKEGVDYFEA